MVVGNESPSNVFSGAEKGNIDRVEEEVRGNESRPARHVEVEENGTGSPNIDACFGEVGRAISLVPSPVPCRLHSLARLSPLQVPLWLVSPLLVVCITDKESSPISFMPFT